MAPAAKRRKTQRVVDSDEDERPKSDITRFLTPSPNPRRTGPVIGAGRGSTASPSPLRKSNRAKDIGDKSSNGTNAIKPIAKTQTKTKGEEKGKTADLLTLFSNQARKPKSGSLTTTARSKTEADQIISDPITDDDDDISFMKAGGSSIVGQKAKKRLRNGTHAPPSTLVSASSTSHTTAPNASQLFVRPPKPTRPDALDDDLRPWSERFGPVNMEELAVHKRKVADVRKWLEDVMQGKLKQRLLLLKGAAGTGKTTTVRLLARDLGFEILEWRNPAAGFAPGMLSPTAQFEDFIRQGGWYTSLELEGPGQTTRTPDIKASNQLAGKMILIEEFPNTFTRSSTTLTGFRGVISRYLTDNTSSMTNFQQKEQIEVITPIIMIISETLLTTTSATADSFTAHRLLGPEILRHPGTGVIEFNPIATSLLSKALELVVVKESRISGRRRTPGPQVLKRLGEIGDIRNAVASLEFLLLKGDQDADWGAKVALTKSKKSVRDGIAMTKGEAETLEQVSQREASLGIFHAVGKVVYNRREEAPSDDTAKALPEYFSHLARPKKSLVAVDSLIDETGTDTGTFISALHENYALSCEPTGPRDPNSPVDYVNGCLDALSDADLLCPTRDIFFGGRRGWSGTFAGRDMGSHVLRQDEMAFHVAVRGMLFSLPHPVKRVASGAGRNQDTFKMFYPTSIKLWRPKEEMEALVDLWSTKLLNGLEEMQQRSVSDGANRFLRTNQPAKSVLSPSKYSNSSKLMSSFSSRSSTMSAQEQQQDGGHSAPLLSLGSAARRELLLERLPYMAQIARAKKISFASMRQRELEKVVSFHGIGPQAALADEEDAAEESNENQALGSGSSGLEAWATDKPTEETTPRKRGVGIRRGVERLVVEKLCLSDDDIEDD